MNADKKEDSETPTRTMTPINVDPEKKIDFLKLYQRMVDEPKQSLMFVEDMLKYAVFANDVDAEDPEQYMPYCQDKARDLMYKFQNGEDISKERMNVPLFNRKAKVFNVMRNAAMNNIKKKISEFELPSKVFKNLHEELEKEESTSGYSQDDLSTDNEEIQSAMSNTTLVPEAPEATEASEAPEASESPEASKVPEGAEASKVPDEAEASKVPDEASEASDHDTSDISDVSDSELGLDVPPIPESPDELMNAIEEEFKKNTKRVLPADKETEMLKKLMREKLIRKLIQSKQQSTV